MQHLFVEYELALELKEAGFNELCMAAYAMSGIFYPRFGYDMEADAGNEIYGAKNSDKDFDGATAPIYQQVFDWLETKGIFIEYYFRFKDKEYGVFIVDGEEYTLWTSMDKAAPEWFKTKQQAWDRAIREALRILKEKKDGN